MSNSPAVTSTKSRAKPSDATKKQSKRDPYLIAVVVLVIFAVIFLIITLSILFAFANKAILQEFKGRLYASAVFFLISSIGAVVLALLILSLMSQRRKGTDSKSLKYLIMGLSIGLVVFLLIASVITFLTANQARSRFASEASGIQAAGVFGLLTFLVLAAAFIIILMRINKKEKAMRM